MKHEQHVQGDVLPALDRIKLEYAALLQSPPISLQELFEPHNLRFSEFTKDFNPHPQSGALQKAAEAFGRHYGIWLENAKHYITCTLFLYPTAQYDRLAAIVKNNAVDYFLNDTMGRDVFHLLTFSQQIQAQKIVERMATIDDSLEVIGSAHAIEQANAEVLQQMSRASTPSWFREFLKFYSHHIGVTHRDLNSSALNHIAQVQEYIEMRNHTAGMHHIILLIEYSTANFLNWKWLEKIRLAYPIRRLHYVVAAFGALSNDLFSFEKEVIDNDSDSNLVMSILLNNCSLSLKEALLASARIVQQLLEEFSTLMSTVRMNCQLITEDTPLLKGLKEHLEGLERCLQASWLWQVYTKRYKRPASLWIETTSAPKEVV